MKKINIIYQAQIKNQFIKIGVSEYLLRLSKYIKNELNIVKIQEKKIVFEKYKKNKNYNICLTEEGKKFDTINFAQKINGLLFYQMASLMTTINTKVNMVFTISKKN